MQWPECGRGVAPAISPCRRTAERQAADAWPACFPKSFASARSSIAFEKFVAELLPLFNQSVPLQDAVEFVRVNRAVLDELQNPRVIFRASGLQRDGREMFGGHHAR